jgi:hypothetical protein
MFAVCAVAGLVAAVLTVVGMLGTGRDVPVPDAVPGQFDDAAVIG